MADKKISQLEALAAVSASDLLVVVQDPGGVPVTKKATVANVIAAAGGFTGTITWPDLNGTTHEITLSYGLVTGYTTSP
jgi:hypothetical protein